MTSHKLFLLAIKHVQTENTIEEDLPLWGLFMIGLLQTLVVKVSVEVAYD